MFGKNTIGGAINIISVKPTGESGGYAKVTVGRFNRIDARGSFDFPIVENKGKLFPAPAFSKILPINTVRILVATNPVDFLNNRVFDAYEDIIKACVNTWNCLIKNKGQIKSITARK